MTKHAIVIGIKGIFLSEKEKEYLVKYKPVGVILFKRNISNKIQVTNLIKDIKLILGSKTIIMVDQEGGKVSRLDKKFWPIYPSASFFGKIALEDIGIAKKKNI